jgi:hypothetical protein
MSVAAKLADHPNVLLGGDAGGAAGLDPGFDLFP